MIDLPPALHAHTQREVTSLAYCWTIKRKDGTTYGFTDHDETLIVNAIVHDPMSGLTGSAVEAELGLAVSTMDVEGALRSDKISADDLRDGKFGGANVDTWLVNWNDASQFILLKRSKIGRVEISGGVFRAELQSITEALDKRCGRIIRRNCDAQLGDERCGKTVTTAQFQAVASVTSIINQNDLKVTGISNFSSKWFEGGQIEWLTGGNADDTSTVVEHEHAGAQARLSIWQPLRKAIKVGDNFRITAGCNKTFATCQIKFNNQLNFRGFPHLPGNDAVYTYVDGTGIFDGAALVS